MALWIATDMDHLEETFAFSVRPSLVEGVWHTKDDDGQCLGVLCDEQVRALRLIGVTLPKPGHAVKVPRVDKTKCEVM